MVLIGFCLARIWTIESGLLGFSSSARTFKLDWYVVRFGPCGLVVISGCMRINAIMVKVLHSRYVILFKNWRVLKKGRVAVLRELQNGVPQLNLLPKLILTRPLTRGKGFLIPESSCRTP